VSFKYLGVFFDTGHRWETQARYVQKRSIAGVPLCMIMLYKGLVEFVWKYSSICYSGMGRTHLLRLVKVQFRGIRIALGLI
jgi:hypothetical protein